MATPVSSVDVTPTTTGSWVDVDVSSHVNAGSTAGVFLNFVNTDTAEHEVGVRKNGSTDDIRGDIEPNAQTWFAIGVDSNDVFEAYIASTNVEIHLIGYLENAEATFLTNADAHTTGSLAVDSWHTFDFSSVVGSDSPTYVFVQAHNNGTEFGEGWAVRYPNQTDLEVSANAAYKDTLHGAHCAVNSTPEFEGYVDDGGLDYYVVGWANDGIVGISGTPSGYTVSTSGVYETMDTSTDTSVDANMAFFYDDPGTVPEKHGFRETGASYDRYYDITELEYPIIQLDSSQQFELKQEERTNENNLIGYGEPTVTVQTITADVGSVTSDGPAPSLGLGTATVTDAENTIATSSPTPTIESGATLEADVGTIAPTPRAPSLSTSGLATVDADVAQVSASHNDHRLYEQGVGIKDSFEDGDMSEYVGDTGEVSAVNVGSANAVHGDWVLRSGPPTGGDGFSKVTAQSITWPQSTTPLSAYVKSDSGSDGVVHLLFGVQDADNHYYASLDIGSERLQVGRIENGFRTNLGTDIGFSLSADTYYRLSATRESNDELTAAVHDTDGNVIATRTSISSDTTFASETGIGYVFEENATATLEVDYVTSGSEVVVPADVGDVATETPDPAPSGSGTVSVSAGTATATVTPATPTVPTAIPVRVGVGDITATHNNAFRVTPSLGSGATAVGDVGLATLSGVGAAVNATGTLTVRSDVAIPSVVGFDAVGIDQFIELPSDHGETALDAPQASVSASPVTISADVGSATTAGVDGGVDEGTVTVASDTALATATGPDASSTGHGDVSATSDVAVVDPTGPDASIGPSPVSVASDIATTSATSPGAGLAFTGASIVTADVGGAGTSSPEPTISLLYLVENVYSLRGEVKTVWDLVGNKDMTAVDQNIGVNKDGSLDDDEKYFSGDDAQLRVTTYGDDGNIQPISSPSEITYVLCEERGGVPILEYTYSDGDITVTDPTGGVITIDVSGSATAPLSGYYYHECELLDSSGNTSTLFEGNWYIFTDSA